MSELSNLKSSVSLFENTLKKAREAREFLNLDISEEEANLVSEDINSIKDSIKKLRLEILLMESLISVMLTLKYIVVQGELRVMTGLICYLECI